MQIARSFKIAFSPGVATRWYLGIVGLMAFVQSFIIDPLSAPVAGAYTIGYTLWAFALKLLTGVMCSKVLGDRLETLPRFVRVMSNFFMGDENKQFPRFTITSLSLILFLVGSALVFPSFLAHLQRM